MVISKEFLTPLPPLSEDEIKAKVDSFFNTPRTDLEAEVLFNKNSTLLEKLDQQRKEFFKEIKPLPVLKNLENNL